MRKTEKEHLIAMLETLQEAHEELISQPAAVICSILAGCQESAIAIGNKIEASGEAGKDTISLLEGYCDVIYHLNTAVLEGSNWQPLNHSISSSLSRISESISEEIAVKLEILFLPYKASMWDSMESIWLAAEQDPNCICKVMPIPYLERSQDRKSGELRYEGELFPLGIPITDYNHYQLSAHRPDIIYIHNPYDKYNIVTTVHPAFYSAELKKYTDMLVYVPYFVTNGKMPENQIELPAYLYVDKIILQNKRMLKEMAGFVVKAKLAALGSPKFDRMLRLHRSRPVLPREWEDIIQEKKVFFYNTSITRLLEDTERELNKMKGVFAAFQKHPEVVLIWRPHPLFQATLKSMRSEYISRFEELEKQFEERQIGIIDRTPDINRTVALCDAYLGEESSSVVQLFQVSGKPVFAVNSREAKERSLQDLASVRILNFTFDGEEIWFIAYEYGVLCRMDLMSGKIAAIPMPEGEAGIEYADLVKYNNKILLLPGRGNSICEYDLETEHFSKFYFEPFHYQWGYPYIPSVIRCEEDIYIIPCRCPDMIKYHPANGRLSYLRNWQAELYAQDGQSGEQETFLRSDVHKDGIIYFSSLNRNMIIAFDTNRSSFKFYVIGRSEERFRLICHGEKYIWLSSYHSHVIYRWCPEENQEENQGKNQLEEYSQFPQGFMGGEWKFYAFEEEQWLYLFPIQANMPLKLHLETGKIESWNINDGRSQEEYNQQYAEGNVIFSGGKRIAPFEYLLYSGLERCLLRVNARSGITKRVPCRLEQETLQELLFFHMGKQFKNNNYLIYREDERQSLDTFIEMVKQGRHDHESQFAACRMLGENMDGSSGRKIHEYITDAVINPRQH